MELEGHISQISPHVAHAAVNHIKGVKILWGNCRGGKILLNASKFSFPSMKFPKMLPMWLCGDNTPKNSSLQNALVQICEAGKEWKTKPVKYDNLSETCYESGGDSELE